MSKFPLWSIVGLTFGTILGVTGAFGGFGAFLVVLVLGVVGFGVGRIIEGETDVAAWFARRQ